MQLVGRSCEHCRGAIFVAHEALGCAGCGRAMHARCVSAADGYRGRVTPGACTGCGAALTSDAPRGDAPTGAWTPRVAMFVGTASGVFLGVIVTALLDHDVAHLGLGLEIVVGTIVAIVTITTTALVTTRAEPN